MSLNFEHVYLNLHHILSYRLFCTFRYNLNNSNLTQFNECSKTQHFFFTLLFKMNPIFHTDAVVRLQQQRQWRPVQCGERADGCAEGNPDADWPPILNILKHVHDATEVLRRKRQKDGQLHQEAAVSLKCFFCLR